ncbi:MAG TPA: Gp37 family protein [Candidatus Binataceae bacterium]|nr:Gp37 family protein [Candidatus Binataceae bacterium]
MAAVMLDASWTGVQFAPAQPIDIATIELALVARLASQITSVEVAHFPDSPHAYRLTHRIGAALVRYEGADYGPLKDTAAIVQERTLKFAVSLLVRDLGWSFGGEPDGTSPGGYALLESIRAALTGFRIRGFSKAYPVSEKFLERDKQGGVWIYAITFGLKTMAVEPSVIENYPLFVLGVAQEKGGITTISVAPAPYAFDASGEITLPNGNITALEMLNPSTGFEYIAGTDYSANAVTGVISANPSGAIPPGATVSIAYSYGETVTAVPSQAGDPSAGRS